MTRHPFIIRTIIAVLFYGLCHDAFSYHIKIKFNRESGQYLYLYSTYCWNNFSVDSAKINSNGFAIFENKSDLPLGIYTIVYKDTALVNFIPDQDSIIIIYHPTPENDDIRLRLNYTVLGGEENDLNNESIILNYRCFVEKKISIEEFRISRASIIRKNPTSYVAALLRGTIKNKPDDSLIKVQNREGVDSIQYYRYLKTHYLDSVEFSERMLRTSILSSRVWEYITLPIEIGDNLFRTWQEDSLIKSVSYVLELSSVDQAVYSCLSKTLYNSIIKQAPSFQNFKIEIGNKIISNPYTDQSTVNEIKIAINNAKNELNQKYATRTYGTEIISNEVNTVNTKVSDTISGSTYKHYEDNSRNDFEYTKIGNQVWMKKNLDVTKFRNGDPIPEAQTLEQWKKADANKTPAWCYYQSDPRNNDKLGKLYNWYAVNDPRGLAPEGWHIPSSTEWKILIKELSGKTSTNFDLPIGDHEAVLKMNLDHTYKEFHYLSGKPRNTSGFSSISSGYRWNYGEFFVIGVQCLWWSTTEYRENGATDKALKFDVYYPKGELDINDNYKGAGISVRCLQD